MLLDSVSAAITFDDPVIAETDAEVTAANTMVIAGDDKDSDTEFDIHLLQHRVVIWKETLAQQLLKHLMRT